MTMLEDIRTSQTAQELPSVSAIVRFLLPNLEWVVGAKDWHLSDDEGDAVDRSDELGPVDGVTFAE